MILGEYFVSLIAQHRLASVPLLYKPLLQSETQHWHPRVRILAKNVLKLLDGMEVISAKLSITVPDLKEEDLTLINNLISSFDNGDI